MALSVYIHYPFCVRKCLYCDFLSWPCGADARRAYLTALLQEIACSGMEGADVDTVFIGGGTPSLMEEEELAQLLAAIRRHFRVRKDAEITMECNPGTVDKAKLQAFRKAGVNRLSIGVQSFHDEELQLLGRIHTSQEAVCCFNMAREAGFDNINMDLMSALPGQSYEAWMDNLAMAVQLAPEHISAYSLILEDGTPLKKSNEAGLLPPVPDDEVDRKMYHDTLSFLQAAGYPRYEISNYAREGFACRHNLGYWSGHEYLGLGLGASSLIGNVRFHNTDRMEEYLWLCAEPASITCASPRVRCVTSASIRALGEQKSAAGANDADVSIPFTSPRLPGLVRDVEVLSLRDQMGEFMWLGLRKTAGVSEALFRQRFGHDLMEVFGSIIEGHIRKGLLQRQNGMIRLTEYGTDISNYVFCDFV